MIKRIFDIIVSITALTLLLPVFIIVYLYVKSDSEGPVFFKQTRIGRNSVQFVLFKYRSMYFSTPQQSKVGKEHSKQAARNNYQTTVVNDPRITKAGRFIRKYYLDELPQLINVLRGDMSIVGPRPDAPVQEVDYSISQWERRHRVTPGMTGLAQLYQGNAKFTASTRIALDLFYAKKSSLCFDMSLLLRTIMHVLRGSSF